MKAELMPTKTANDFIAIRDKVMNGEFASVKEDGSFKLYALLESSRCDCHCHCMNGIAVFGKMSTKDFYKFVLELGHLEKNKLANMPVDKVDRFVEYANAYGLNVMGGALSNDCQTQYLYID